LLGWVIIHSVAPLNIITVPNKVLSRTARRVQPGEDLRELFGQMAETMNERGVGLAAPQVGMSVRFFVAMDPETHEIRGFVNPQISWFSPDKKTAAEGCLSIPGAHAFVERSLGIRMRYQDLDFEEHEEAYEGWYARILQHEFDHLNGVLISDRAVDGMHPDEDDTDEVADADDVEAAQDIEESEIEVKR
jgi:peptide deformylase